MAKTQSLIAAVNPMAAVKKFPMPKAPTTWNARHPLTPLVQKRQRRRSST